MIFCMYNNKTYTKECGFLLIQQTSSIVNNNNLTSQNCDSFYTRKKYFWEHSGFPPVVTFLAHFYQKDMCWSWFFTQHFVRNCSQFVILWQLRIPEWIVNNLLCTWYTLFWCPFISKSSGSVVDRSFRNPWIGGSNPGGNNTSFSV